MRFLQIIFIVAALGVGVTMLWLTTTDFPEAILSMDLPATTTTPAETEVPSPNQVPQRLGRLFMVGHWAHTPYASTTALIAEYGIGGVIIMSTPDDPSEIRTWTNKWQEASDVPLIIAIDQEGGPVTRLKGEGFVQTGQRGIDTPQEASDIARVRGAELKELGITMNLSPVLDQAHNPDSFMYERVFPSTSSSTKLATAMLEGYQINDIIGVPKHFPGHDDTSDDSHLMLPVVNISLDELDVFTTSFRDLLHTYPVKALMTAHVSFPQIDPLPATLSHFFLTTYLRETLGFEGVIITDDLSMDAIDNIYGAEKATVLSLAAGADLIMFAAEPERVRGALQEVQHALESGELEQDTLTAHLTRLETLHAFLER